VIYLVSAYVAAVVILGGYLAWSLRSLRRLSERAAQKR
jgi:hypothetical protein